MNDQTSKVLYSVEGRSVFADIYPQLDNQPEDIMDETNVRTGYVHPITIRNETPSAFDVIQESLAASLVQLGEEANDLLKGKIELPVSRKSVFQVAERIFMKDNNREIWLDDLSNSHKSLAELANYKLPLIGLKDSKIVDICILRNVPLKRAVWFIKCIGYNEMRTSSPSIDQNTSTTKDWTKVMFAFICDEISKASVGGDDTAKRIAYLIPLCRLLYDDRMIQQLEFLHLLLRLFQPPKSANLRQISILTTFIGAFLAEFGNSRSLSRVLISICAAYDNQEVKKLQQNILKLDPTLLALDVRQYASKGDVTRLNISRIFKDQMMVDGLDTMQQVEFVHSKQAIINLLQEEDYYLVSYFLNLKSDRDTLALYLYPILDEITYSSNAVYLLTSLQDFGLLDVKKYFEYLIVSDNITDLALVGCIGIRHGDDDTLATRQTLFQRIEGHQDQEEVHIEECKALISKCLPKVFAIESPVDEDIQGLRKYTHFVQICACEWLRGHLFDYVVQPQSVGMNNWKQMAHIGTSLLSPEQVFICIEIFDTCHDYHTLLEVSLWLLVRTLDDRIESSIVDLLSRFRNIYVAMECGSMIFTTLWTKFKGQDTSQAVTKALLFYYQFSPDECDICRPYLICKSVTKKDELLFLREMKEDKVAVMSAGCRIVKEFRSQDGVLRVLNYVVSLLQSRFNVVSAATFGRQMDALIYVLLRLRLNGRLLQDALVVFLHTNKEFSDWFLDFLIALTAHQACSLLHVVTDVINPFLASNIECSNPVIFWISYLRVFIFSHSGDVSLELSQAIATLQSNLQTKRAVGPFYTLLRLMRDLSIHPTDQSKKCLAFFNAMLDLPSWFKRIASCDKDLVQVCYQESSNTDISLRLLSTSPFLFRSTLEYEEWTFSIKLVVDNYDKIRQSEFVVLLLLNLAFVNGFKGAFQYFFKLYQDFNCDSFWSQFGSSFSEPLVENMQQAFTSAIGCLTGTLPAQDVYDERPLSITALVFNDFKDPALKAFCREATAELTNLSQWVSLYGRMDSMSLYEAARESGTVLLDCSKAIYLVDIVKALKYAITAIQSVSSWLVADTGFIQCLFILATSAVTKGYSSRVYELAITLMDGLSTDESRKISLWLMENIEDKSQVEKLLPFKPSRSCFEGLNNSSANDYFQRPWEMIEHGISQSPPHRVAWNSKIALEELNDTSISLAHFGVRKTRPSANTFESLYEYGWTPVTGSKLDATHVIPDHVEILDVDMVGDESMKRKVVGEELSRKKAKI